VAGGVEAVRVAPGGGPQPEPRRLGVHGPGEAGTDPPAASASITATSLADTIIRALRACSTVSFWPRLTASRRAGWAAAAFEATVTVSRSRLARTARAVSILVRLAGGAGVRLRRPQSTSPVTGSTRIAYLARTSFPGPEAGLGAAAAAAGTAPAATTRATSSTRSARSVPSGDKPDQDVAPVTSGRHPLESSGAISVTRT
jgi:hypothetical protein